jgi:hypothetical protein
VSLIPQPSPDHSNLFAIGIPNAAYRFQTLGNAVSFISALIAALLYGNIGIKVLYSAVFRDVFKLPPLDKKMGKLIWVALGSSPPLHPLPSPPLTNTPRSSHLLGPRLDNRRRHPANRQPHLLRRRPLHPTILLHLPPHPPRRLQRPERRYAPRRNL